MLRCLIVPFVALAGFLAAQPGVPFLSPDAALGKMDLADGFAMQAFAADAPQVVQPFAFAFDERGRMWVAENLNYRSRGSDSFAEGPQGRIAILEDTDGDGAMDKRTVFQDQLFFPTGLALGHGGVWVGSPPNLLFIPDRNRDDRPDGEPEVVLDGWGRQDRHETLNSFLWGPDGWLYGCHGVFTHSAVGKPGTPEEQRVKINAGVWRMHPVTHAFEVFAYGTSNPWGLDFDKHGQAFVTACVIPHLWHMIQGGRYHRQAGKHFNPHVYEVIRTVADHRHLSAHGGARFYQADQFPEAYRDRLFMCNLHQHNVITDRLERRGTGFVGLHGDVPMKANDPQWLGFNMELGPDGALYIIDWHDADICGRKVVHPDTGRVWRLAHQDGMPGIPTFDLTRTNDLGLVAMQAHPNDWYTRQARRLLHERALARTLDPAAHAALHKQLVSAPDSAAGLRALWALQLTGGIDDKGLTKLLAHADENVRAWAIQLLCEDRDVSPAIAATLVRMAREDSSARVRLYLASAAQRLGTGHRSWAILSALAQRAEDAEDHNQPLMIWYGLEPMIAHNPERARALRERVQVKHLADFIDRRLKAGRTDIVSVPARSPDPEAGAVKPIAKRVKPAESVPTTDMVLWYRADGVVETDGLVRQWTDRLREGRHAKAPDPAASPKLAKVAGRTAVQFDGKDDRLELAHDKQLAFRASDNYTLAVWAYIDPRGNQSGWRSLVAKSRDQDPWWGLWLNNGTWVYGGDNFTAGKARAGWHQLTLVQHANADRRIYLDGELVARAKARSANGAGDLWFGAAKGTREFWRGALSEIRLYRRDLSHAEAARLSVGAE